MLDLAAVRRSGLLVPLFSAATTESWGIGELADLPAIAAWMKAAGQGAIQLLPINEMAPGQHSPYSAISAMAIDPIYIRVSDVPDFGAIGGDAALSASDRAELSGVRQAARIDYSTVRDLKSRWLRRAFDRFFDAEWRADTARARRLKEFVAEQAWWIHDYGLFRAFHARHGEAPWTEWPPELRRRDPAALDAARRDAAADVLFHQYLQWIAAVQWQEARRLAGIAVLGDLPFMVDGDSADVWIYQDCFHLDASLGAPPDAFSATGQDWGMPVYNWKQMAAADFSWLRARARRSADLFDAYRVDHLVGFYRTYGRSRNGGAPFFTPADEASQTALGERVLTIFRAAGAGVIAEDLGVVPDFVRESLVRLGIPGFRVFRWERYWHTDGQPFRDPTEYPPISVAATGTHDTEPLVSWWGLASDEEKRAVSDLPSVQRLTGGVDLALAAMERVRDVVLEALFASASTMLLLPVQDVFGWSERINEPGTVDDKNWTFKLPWPADALDDVAEARDRQASLRDWSSRYQRS
jgi:4-alpha-glucanotransferase